MAHCRKEAMQVDIDRSKELVKEAKGVFLTPKSVEVLAQLIQLRKDIDLAIVEARQSAEKILAALQNV